MKENKTLKISENFEYNPLNYLNENVEINYLMFEKPYKEAWYTFRKENKLKWNLPNLQGIIKLWNTFNVKEFKWWEDFIFCNVISLVKVFLIYEIYKLKFPNNRISEIYDNLENNNSRLQYLDYFIDYYCYLVKQWKEVNFYITDNATLILTPEEYNMNRQMATSIVWYDNTVQTAIIISLNEILAKVYNDDKIRRIKNRLTPLSQKELDILIEMNFNPWILDLNITFDKKTFEPKELKINSKLDFEEWVDFEYEAKKRGYWKFNDVKFHKGKITSWKATKKIKLDKDNENYNIKKLPNKR